MIAVNRASLFLTLLVAVVSHAAAGQNPILSVLHIKIILVDAERTPIPVPRHALLISDDPVTAAPRRVITTLDGTVDVRLRPGRYVIESDAPVAFNGKAYEWTQTVTIAAGRDAALELTVGNAEITVAAAGATSAVPLEVDHSLDIAQLQPSVVTLWTPTARASGFVIDADGLLVTNQRSIGTAKTIEVQVTPTLKVAGAIVVADAARDVALVRIDPGVAAPLPPVPLVCTSAQPQVVNGQKLFTIDMPLHQPKTVESGTASQVTAHNVESDLYLSPGSAGGPVFTTDGVVGITSVADDVSARSRRDVRIVPIDDVCGVVATARERANAAAIPGAARLPVEPEQRFPVDALKQAVQRRAGSLNPYQVSSSSFDLFFMTPVMIYAAQDQKEQRGRALADFGGWSEYVAAVPPVLFIRMMPKMVESFWTKVARGAAQTQGVAIPSMKRLGAGFSRMRAYCGDTEVTPIHPFTIGHRVSETERIDEGLYVFDPGALGPSCASVKLVLYSEKDPAKPETLTVDAKVIQRIWDDFAPYRALSDRDVVEQRK